MKLQDHKSTIFVLAIVLAYFLFFHNHHTANQKFQIGQKHIIFHANWTKSIDEVCCLHKYQDALSLQNIQSLDISFSMSSFPYEDTLKLFPQQFRQYKNLKIEVSSLPLGNKGIDYILSLIPNGVQNLQLGFNGIKTQDGIGKIIAQRLNNLSTLKSLKISLIMAMKNTEVAEYFQIHKPSDSLKVYYLILVGNDINSQSLKYIESYFSKIKLNELVLNLYANKAGAEGAAYLANVVKSQNTLQQLTLDLYFNNITEVGTENITQTISEMTNLKYLELNLDFNYIKNEGGKSIGQMLPKMINLETLNLGVASKNFGYLGFKDVIKGLEQLTQLKKLTLRCGVNRVGYNGAEITKNMLQKMTNLQVLELGFIQNYIGDDGITLLAQQVAKMTTLKSVYLNLAFNDAKSFGLIKVIKAFLKNHFNILHISLSNNEFRDTDVKLVQQHFPTLIKNNDKFILEFSDTAISKVEMKRLQDLWNDSNKKFDKDSDLYVNSIIPDEPQKKPEVKEAKPEAKTQKPKQEKKPQASNNKSSTEL